MSSPCRVLRSRSSTFTIPTITSLHLHRLSYQSERIDSYNLRFQLFSHHKSHNRTKKCEINTRLPALSRHPPLFEQTKDVCTYVRRLVSVNWNRKLQSVFPNSTQKPTPAPRKCTQVTTIIVEMCTKSRCFDSIGHQVWAQPICHARRNFSTTLQLRFDYKYGFKATAN